MDPAIDIPPWLARAAGADSLCAYLRALGRDATMVRVPEKPLSEDDPASSWRERHLVFIAHSPIHLVSLYAAWIAPKTISLAHHYVVRTDRSRVADGAYDARLGQAFRGVFLRTRTRLSFVGGDLARQLQHDVGLRTALLDHLGPNDDLVVMPDVRRGLVRVVHVHPLSARRPLLKPEPTAFYEGFLPEPLLCALERIALHIRAVPNRSESRSA
jgi:hypothetical protein